MASRSKADLHPILVEVYVKAEGLYKCRFPTDSQPFITCTYRSNEEQEQLYAQGRTKKGAKVTNARAGQSPHNYNPSLAFDIAFLKLDKKLDWNKELFKKFADIVKEVDGNTVEWGGSWKWKDFPHFQLKEFKKYLKLQA